MDPRTPRKILTDSWDQDRHLSMKRWERGAQRAAWKVRAVDHAAPPLPCLWRASAGATRELRAAHLLALFSGELALVRFADRARAADGIRLVRGGIPWEQWGPVILRAWLDGTPVPAPFRALRRLPSDWLEKAVEWNPAEQRAFFDKLREAGVLPPLHKVGAEALAPWLRWEDARAHLLDFTQD